MIRPHLKNDLLLQDIATAPGDTDLLHVWWLGQSGFLIRWANHAFLFDPYLSDSLTHKYAQTDKPHTRMTERCVAPDKLTGLTFVTASHLHTDHLDAETLRPLAQQNPSLPLFLPAAIQDEAKARLGDTDFIYRPLDHGVRHEEDDWSLEGIAAAHNDLKKDAQGRHHYLGFILRCGPFTVYHSGDTLWHEGLVETLRPLSCDLMLLPINGNKPERRVAGNLDGAEAASLAKTCNAGLVIPCHYDMFTFNTATPELFQTTCKRLEQPFHILPCGGRLTL